MPKSCAYCGKPLQGRQQKFCSRSCGASGHPTLHVTIPLAERFAKYLPESRADDECWEWTGACDYHGYGRLNLGRHGQGIGKAHRISYEIHVAPIPKGMIVLHRCDNPPCVNPSHLRLGTMSDNTQDMLVKRRGVAPTGAANGKTTVPDDVVREIRRRWDDGERIVDLAATFGLRYRYVQALVGRERRTAI